MRFTGAGHLQSVGASALCSRYREWLSAYADGEESRVSAAELEAHLGLCPGCARWFADAQAVSRRARLQSAEDVPDLSHAILSAAATQRREQPFAVQVARAGLVAVAAFQLALALPVLLSGSNGTTDGMAMGLHVAHESGAWNLGLAIAFLTAAVRPRSAAALLPTVGVLATTFLVITLGDLAAGRVTMERGVTHVLMLVGSALLATLVIGARVGRSHPPRRTVGALVGQLRSHP